MASRDVGNSEKNLVRTSRTKKRQEIIPQGYVALGALATKYGYAQDHVGWLARTSRVDACQVGNKRQWYVREASLKKYRADIASAVAPGYIPLRLAARQYGYAKDYIGWLARNGKIDAQQNSVGLWFVREKSIKDYRDETRRTPIAPPHAVAQLASVSTPPVPPVVTLSEGPSEIPVVRINRVRAAAYLAFLFLILPAIFFRQGVFDCLVGVNLLREGLDLPEVSLIGILDADREGFLRSEVSLIQTIGRAARNVKGRVILYADQLTGSLKRAIDETTRRRTIQLAYNKEHNITPQTIIKNIADITESLESERDRAMLEDLALDKARFGGDIKKVIKEKEKEMRLAVKALDFETAALLRDEIKRLLEN